MSNPWIRLYREALHDPKIVGLNDRQHRAWFNLLLMADDAGVLPAIKHIAINLRIPTTDAVNLVDELIDEGLVDVNVTDGPRAYSIHGWCNRQFLSDSSAARVRKHREKKACNDDVTATKRYSNGTDPDSETEGVNNPSHLEPARDEGSEGSNFDLSGVRVGVQGRVSIEAQRKAAVIVGVQDAFPLVLLFEGWRESRNAKHPDAMFVKAAPKLFANAPLEIKAACQPIPKPEEEINTAPVAASPQLAALLRRRTNA